MLTEKTKFDDVRIELMYALLNNSEVSQEGFNAIASLIDNVSGTKSNDTWNAFRAQFAELPAGSEQL